MERNRWETAIRCLEIAVHPNTSAEEAIAALNGFRRTANNAPLDRVCREWAGAAPAHLLDRLDQLNHENRDLRRKVSEAETQQASILKRMDAVERHAHQAAEAVVAAEQRTAIAEQQLAEFRGAYGRISGGLNQENAELKRALDGARHNLKQPIHEPVAPFQTMLDVAMQRPAPSTIQPALANRPWTA